MKIIPLRKPRVCVLRIDASKFPWLAYKKACNDLEFGAEMDWAALDFELTWRPTYESIKFRMDGIFRNVEVIYDSE